jgi:hypothetical protein
MRELTILCLVSAAFLSTTMYMSYLIWEVWIKNGFNGLILSIVISGVLCSTILYKILKQEKNESD